MHPLAPDKLDAILAAGAAAYPLGGPRAALLDLLLHAQLVCVTALLLPAVDCSGVQASIAPAQHDQLPVSAETLHAHSCRAWGCQCVQVSSHWQCYAKQRRW